MSRALNILAPKRYPWRFNSPKDSGHKIINHNFLPLNFASTALEGITAFSPSLPGQFDLIHAFNRIPITFLPFVIGFESHLPRGFGIENTRFFSWMVDRLASRQCRAIIAISEFARRTFLTQHEGDERLEVLASKLRVCYPSIPMPKLDMSAATSPPPLRLLFVGDHFARKGGCVCLRIAELAWMNHVPIELDVVSSLEIGAVSWTDPTNKSYFDHDMNLLRLPNVRYHGKVANSEVLSMMRVAHFTMLLTFSDTFGYSALESMANGTPVVGTTQGALPEFIHHRSNGLLLELPTGLSGEWVHIGRSDRGSREYEQLHRKTIEELAVQGFEILKEYIWNPDDYSRLRSASRATAERKFSSDLLDPFWNGLYLTALEDPKNRSVGSRTDRRTSR